MLYQYILFLKTLFKMTDVVKKDAYVYELTEVNELFLIHLYLYNC